MAQIRKKYITVGNDINNPFNIEEEYGLINNNIYDGFRFEESGDEISFPHIRINEEIDAIENQESTVELVAGEATVVVASTTGYIVGAAVTKTSGEGSFGNSAKIKFIKSETEFSLDVNHTSSGNITFTVSNSISYEKSGVLTSNYLKYLVADSSLPGTLPTSKITTGKKLQSLNDPFDDTNILTFDEIENSNSNFSIPLIPVQNQVAGTETYENVSFYMTTNSDLLDAGSIKKDDYFYRSNFDIENSKVFDSPNIFEATKNSTRLVRDKHLHGILFKNNFEEEYTPYTEDSRITNFANDEFDTYTVDSENNKNYRLSDQKEIKIVIDFSEQGKEDLVLLNTKMSFIESKTSGKTVPGFTHDVVRDLDYFNFIMGDNPKSYSSHFLPTAYWNFKKGRWNYLDNFTTKYSEDNLNRTPGIDFDPDANFEDSEKYKFLGARHKTTGGYSNGRYIEHRPAISNKFVFSGGGTFQEQEVYDDFVDNNFMLHSAKPILTTPSFRPDGSLLLNQGTNKNPISSITSTYGFPYSSTWQPKNEHLLDMSDYLSNDFLVEKMIIKGKLTSKGELPYTIKNVASGYENSFAYTNNNRLQILGSPYTMKDANFDCLANNLTFFILNERKGINFFKNKKEIETTQSYYVSEIPSSIPSFNNLENISGVSLKDFSGSFSSYYSGNANDDPLNVYGHSVPNSSLYSVDKYNQLELNGLYNFSEPDFYTKLNLSKNIFHYLDSNTDYSGDDVINFLSLNENTLDEDSAVYNRTNFKTHNIRLEEIDGDTEHEFDTSKGRELVTYSNMLILGKYDDVEVDNKVLENIDNIHTLNFERIPPGPLVTNNLNLNIDEPLEFEVKSFFKNIEKSDYIDETTYKLKSNYEKVITVGEEGLSSSPIMLGSVLNETFLTNVYPGNSDINTRNILFDFVESAQVEASVQDGAELKYILGGKAKEYSDIHAEYSNLIPYTHHHYVFSPYRLRVPNSIFYNNDPWELTFPQYVVSFSYSNDLAVTGGQLEHYYTPRESISTTYLKLEDFITYTSSTTTYAYSVVININLRFLDPFYEKGNIVEFNDFAKSNFSSSNSSFYNLSSLLDLSSDQIEIWNNDRHLWRGQVEDEVKRLQKQENLLKLIYIALINAPVYYRNFSLDASNGTGPTLYTEPVYNKIHTLLNFDIDPTDTSTSPGRLVEFKTLENNCKYGVIRYYESLLMFDVLRGPGGPQEWFGGAISDWLGSDANPFPDGLPEYDDYKDFFGRYTNLYAGTYSQSSENRDSYIHFGREYHTYWQGFSWNEEFYRPAQQEVSIGGSQPITETINNYNLHNILEGKNKGEPNNLGIPSERILNKNIKYKSQLEEDTVLKYAGKSIRKANDEISVYRNSYLLKPEDNLVFGVSSNSNGEVLQTATTFHDKIEITLIGRDYIDSKKQKSSECKSVRKVVFGDSVIEKSMQGINQTLDTYYDNVWSKNNLLNSKQDFISGKEIIGKNSSGELGSYTGLITFEKMFKKEPTSQTTQNSSRITTIYQIDTVNPSLGNVFINCMQKQPLYTVDNYDIYKYFKNKNTPLFETGIKVADKIPSYKIVISDSISDKNLTRYPLRYQRIIHDWHKTFHLEKYKDFFNEDSIQLNSFTYNEITSNSRDLQSNVLVYFDTNSYSAGSNYQNWISFTNTPYSSNDAEIFGISNITDDQFRLYKSLKTYSLPFSKNFVFQNSINLNNNISSEEGTFKNNDLIIDKNLTSNNRNQVLLESYSLQYMLHRIDLDYTQETDDVRALLYGSSNEFGLYENIGDNGSSLSRINDFNFTSSWCLVIDITKENLENLVLNDLKSSNSFDSFENDKIILSDNTEPDNYNIHYYNKQLFLDISDPLSESVLVNQSGTVNANSNTIFLTNTGISGGQTVSTNYLIGAKIIQTGGTGTLGSNATITNISHSTRITVSPGHIKAGTVYFTVDNNTDNYAGCTTKSFKLIKKIQKSVSGVELENSLLNRYILVSPLHFWETNEVNASSSDASDNQNANFSNVSIFNLHKYTGDDSVEEGDLVTYDNWITGYGRLNYPFNDEMPKDTAWYAKASNGRDISYHTHYDIYDDFINYDDTSTPSYDTNKWNIAYIPPNNDYKIKINITGIGGRYAQNGSAQDIVSGDNFNDNLANFHSEERIYPYSIEELTDATKDYYGGGLTSKTKIYLSNSRFLLKEDANSSVTTNKSKLYENLGNNFLINSFLKNIISKEYFENNFNAINQLRNEYQENIFANEKIYMLPCKEINIEKKIEKDVMVDFVCKLKKINNYNIVSIEGLYNKHTLFKKNSLIEDELLYIESNENSLVLHEDKLYKNANRIFKSKTFNIPNINIDLSSSFENLSGFLTDKYNTSISASDLQSVKTIPYSHYKIDFDKDLLDSASDDSNLNADIQPNIDNPYSKDLMLLSTEMKGKDSATVEEPYAGPYSAVVNTGSPIYRLSENPLGYYDKSSQESKISDFFYGFSRKGKNRFPIHRLDGFKYGVESGSKKSIVCYYKNNSYGNFSDKIMGSCNFAQVYSSNKEGLIKRYTVEKKFVDVENGYLYTNDLSVITNTFNKDYYSKSSTPFIEDETNEYSQYYVAPSS